MNTILIGSIASLAAGLATAVGALPVFFTKTVSPRLADTFLGFAAGVMLAASFFSLLVPALAVAEADYGNEVAAALLAIAMSAGSATVVAKPITNANTVIQVRVLNFASR